LTGLEIVGTVIAVVAVLGGTLYASARAYGELKTRQDALEARLGELRELCLTLLSWALGVEGEGR
jgi:hypothetical protein